MRDTTRHRHPFITRETDGSRATRRPDMADTSGNAPSTVELTMAEAMALARRVAADHLDTRSDWLLWEDFPMLSEQAFERLHEAVEAVAKDADDEADGMDVAEDIDSMLLRERAQA